MLSPWRFEQPQHHRKRRYRYRYRGSELCRMSCVSCVRRLWKGQVYLLQMGRKRNTGTLRTPFLQNQNWHFLNSHNPHNSRQNALQVLRICATDRISTTSVQDNLEEFREDLGAATHFSSVVGNPSCSDTLGGKCCMNPVSVGSAVDRTLS